jgi:signal peptidase I
MNNKKKEIFSWVRLIFAALAISFIINNYVIVKAEIPTGSMENTVMTDDSIIALRLAYLFEDPARGDIVVFKYPDDESQNYLKRIIGLPGETIEIVDGKVFVDSVQLEESYLKEVPVGSFGPYTVPKDSYFMMGDNRNISEDARYWEHTYVKKEKILGKAVLRYSPSIKVLH